MNEILRDLWAFLVEYPLVSYCASGFGVAIGLLFIPKRILKTLGEWEAVRGFRPFCPNWLSIAHIWVAWLGFLLYFKWDAYFGLLVVVAGAMMDRMDGKMATALNREAPEGLSKWEQFNFPGKTRMGVWLDPFVDKVTVIPIFVLLTIWGPLWGSLTVLLIASEVAGTAIRLPFLRRWTRRSGSTAVGKIKHTLQWVVFISFMPYERGWVPPDWGASAMNILMSVMTAFAVLSVLSRLKLRRELDEAADAATDLFGHEEDKEL